ncbi:CLUMA_CG001169, isoform A [Clunio marinus]|uniref:CLUMA_CG001169, isoform A n=1 Tax=Clunio marinus TaxID=568069 RepID=A0A1J1HH66_9DIPT|nr:CLUMA_CG001169, isoform A [Clunio marinus]
MELGLIKPLSPSETKRLRPLKRGKTKCYEKALKILISNYSTHPKLVICATRPKRTIIEYFSKDNCMSLKLKNKKKFSSSGKQNKRKRFTHDLQFNHSNALNLVAISMLGEKQTRETEKRTKNN